MNKKFYWAIGLSNITQGNLQKCLIIFSFLGLVTRSQMHYKNEVMKFNTDAKFNFMI